ncbi:methyltransferase domain-containing protein [Paracoccus aurantiacus]|uniref:Methyltransferase domain-containing protein n=1 Tax=Paracoccus aurantiacus TaxID=2599412 RepID=A0A5C6S5Y1_9RHOB|nr:methyltransferase domain-containing protein [Paracoccus aurantiacus]TXB69815.1 methyltransferase domain-containing protein [Paracoccus aurantiacus]
MNSVPTLSDTAPPARRLIDPTALEQHRRRAARQGPTDLLHRIAAEEIQDRLAEINRPFTRVAIVTSWPDFWKDAFPDAHVISDAALLDLPEGLDLVVHAMALHWAEDPVGQIVQCARALKPDGLFIAAMMGGDTLLELRDTLSRAEIEATGGLSPRILPMGEIRDLGALLSRAGLALPVADHLPLQVSYRDLFHLATDLRAMAESNALNDRLRRPTRREVFARAAADYALRYPDPANAARIIATFDMIFLTGWAPDASQQKPLRPGSAKASLIDALTPRET